MLKRALSVIESAVTPATGHQKFDHKSEVVAVAVAQRPLFPEFYKAVLTFVSGNSNGVL